MITSRWILNSYYRLVDHVGFLAKDIGNHKIHEIIKGKVFKVVSLNDTGNPDVILVNECTYTSDNFNLFYIFEHRDIEYFDIHTWVDVSSTQPPNTVYTCPIQEWLMKLGYVITADQTIAGLDVNLRSKEVFICTDFGDITGVKEVIDYINHNYAVKIKQEADKRKAELEAKRLEVLQALSDIDQELKRYEE